MGIGGNPGTGWSCPAAGRAEKSFRASRSTNILKLKDIGPLLKRIWLSAYSFTFVCQLSSVRTAEFSPGLVEKEIEGGNPSVPGHDEISPCVRWCLTRAARYPPDAPAVARFLGLGNWL